MMKNMCKLNFIGKNTVLPQDFEKPGPQFADAFAPQDRSVPPNPPLTLFRSATLNKLHVTTAKEKSDEITKYIDGISDAICSAVDMWMKQATVSGVIINGPVGIMPPASVKGPVITSMIQSKAPQGTPVESKYSKAIANAIGQGWQQWSMGMAGTLTYPMFAAVPAPVAPPAPNIPMPLMLFPSPGEALLVPPVLAKSMMQQFGDRDAAHAKILFDAVSFGFYTVFTLFKLSTLVQNVMGTGPVPIFAPPFVPVGPVIGGMGNGAPGSIA